jgi:hypothetical protein
LRRAWFLAAGWQLPAHLGLALGLGLICGMLARRYQSMIPPLDAVIIGTCMLYPLLLTIWWRLRRPGNSR